MSRPVAVALLENAKKFRRDVDAILAENGHPPMIDAAALTELRTIRDNLEAEALELRRAIAVKRTRADRLESAARRIRAAVDVLEEKVE